MDNTTDQLDQLEQRRIRRITAMERFASTLSAADLVGISPQSEKIQYTHKHKAMKRKGGSPPKVYDAVEMLVDFKAALKAMDYEEALPLYYSLRRMLGYYNW